MQIFGKMGNGIQKSRAWKWLVCAGVLWLLFFIYSAIFATGVLNVSTLQVEYWLLHRPVSRVDCLFYEWRNLGEIPFSGVFILILSGLCILRGYRKRIVLYLLLLLLLCILVETIGKLLLNPPLPDVLRSGMTVLTCPQMYGTPTSTRVAASLGLWWKLPVAPDAQLIWLHRVAATPMDFAHMPVDGHENSFPGGHAMRWSFIGMLASWMFWRHIRPLPLRIVLTVLFFILAFGGGFMQFYIGVHTLADTISGYLFGIGAACCGIALLTLNDPRKQQQEASPDPDQAQQVPALKL